MSTPGRSTRRTSRRRDGPAANEWPPPTLLSEAKSNPRSILLFLAGGPLLIWTLVEWVTKAQETWAWILGTSGVLLALLALASYTLRFFPSLLWHAGWAKSPLRRGVQMVLIWAWLAVALAALPFALFAWLF